MKLPEKIEKRLISDLIPYEINNKIHNQPEVDRLANSINEFGYTYPILIDEKNVILAGHKRLLASKKLGLTEVPVIIKSDLTDAQKKAYRIVDNKSSDESAWDLDALRIELKTLEEMNFNIDQFIIPDFVFREEQPTVVDDEFDIDQISDVFVKSGDTINIGEHWLVCGDATDPSIYNKLLAGRFIDLIVTDPPYGVSYVGKTKDALTIQNDSLSEEELKKLWSSV